MLRKRSIRERFGARADIYAQRVHIHTRLGSFNISTTCSTPLIYAAHSKQLLADLLAGIRLPYTRY